jgi:hypothetical protein
MGQTLNEEEELDPTKAKHQQRLQQKENHIKKQYKLAKMYNYEKYLKQPHRLAKHNTADCGKADCMLCGNPRRTHKMKTIQELKFEQTGQWIEDESKTDKLLGTKRADAGQHR